MQVVQHWIISERTIHLSLAMASQRPRPGSWASEMLELRTCQNMELVMELVTEFTGDQMEMINETTSEAITGTIIEMTAELTGDWIRDWIRYQTERMNEMIMEMTQKMILELTMELTSDQVEIGDQDGCPLTDRPWQSIGMDFMGSLPQLNNFNYLLVVIDWLTSQVHFVPTTMVVTAKGVMWLILKEVVRLHGIPESIVSDRDTRFTSIFWKELQKLMGTKLLMSMAFHPQTDGATEQANRLIALILRIVVDNNQKNWSEKCSMIEFTINSSVNATTGYAPFELNHKYMPRLGQHISTNTSFRGIKQFAQQAVWKLLDAHNAIIEHWVVQMHHPNKHQSPSVQYQPNDLIYLSTKNLTLPKGRARKLVFRFIGPYKSLNWWMIHWTLPLSSLRNSKIGEFLLHFTLILCDPMLKMTSKP